MYQATALPDYVLRIADGAVIPLSDPYGMAQREYAQWLEDGGVLQPYSAPPPPVPEIVTRFQACAALLGAGLLDSVEAIMADASTPRMARLAWTTAQEFRRHSPLVEQLAGALGLDDSALDSLFIAAGSIEA